MRLSLEPGVTVEPGRYTALVAPPGFLVDLLAQPEVDRYTTLYLYGVSSRVLHRLPRRAPRLAVQSCMTVHQLLASLREAYQSIVIVEYDDGIFSSLEGEERDVIFAVGRTLRELVAVGGRAGLRAAGRPRAPGAARDGGPGRLALRRAAGGATAAAGGRCSDPRGGGMGGSS